MISDYFKSDTTDLVKFGKENLSKIFNCLNLQLNDLNLMNLNANEQESHVFVFTKSILKKIILKAYETLDDDMLFEQE